MKLQIAAVALAAVFLAGSSQAGSDDEATLRQIKTVEWPRIYREQDVQALDRLLADDFVVYDSSGATPKAEELAWLAKNAWKNDGFSYRIQRLSIYGDTALIVGEGLVRFASGEKPHQTRYVSSNVFVREDGRWRAVSSHVGEARDEPLQP